jgi:hypothetical protein
LIVHDDSAYVVTVRPEASSRVDSRRTFASPAIEKSGALPASAPPSAQVRKPNDLMRSASRFSATGERCAGASGRSASRDVIAIEMRGSPFARITSKRSLVVISFSDFCTALTLTIASVVIVAIPSLPITGSLSRTTVRMKSPLLETSFALSTS